MKNMTIGTRLGLVFALTFALILTIAGVGIARIGAINEELNLLIEDRFAKTVWANDIIDAVNLSVRALQSAALLKNEEESKAELRVAFDTQKIVLDRIGKLEQTVRSDDGRRRLKAMEEQRAKYAAARDRFIDMMKGGAKKDEAVGFLLTGLRQAQLGYIDSVAELTSYQTELMKQEGKTAEALAGSTKMLLIALTVLALVLGSGLSYFIVRNLRRQLGGEPAAAQELAARIASGDLSSMVTVRPGDTSSLMASMQQMLTAIRALTHDAGTLSEAAVAGRLATRADAAKHQGEFRRIVEGVNNTLDAVIGPLNVAANYVDRISKGDIPPKITDSYNGDFNAIKNNLNQAIEAIGNMVAEAGGLEKAAIEGRLATRADASKYQGDYGRIVQGVNNTLDAVIGPLNVAANYVDRISKGDIPPKITDSYNGDFNIIKSNLNTCIEAVNRMIADANMLSLAAVEGRLSTRADASLHQGDFRKIVEGVNNTLDAVIEPIDEVKRIMTALEAGDLSQSIDKNYNGDFDALKKSVNNTLSRLSATIGDVSVTAGGLSSVAGQVSATSQALSQASSEQASSVEETTASIEQMSASISQNTENAKVTDGIARKAAEDAVKGGNAVKATVEAMNSIADKISIIDDIAYRTDLLALNAAIEAARAGEHGKGFAVVAAEVRKLAERSQIAAQEISELAKSSVSTAEHAGSLLETMLPSIRKTADLVREITAASEEQSTGAEQVTLAMGQLNRVTQQNAASSEELSATAEELNSQADRLRQLMDQFKVTGSGATFATPSAGTQRANLPPHGKQSAGRHVGESMPPQDFEPF